MNEPITLVERFALLSLNNQDSIHLTVAKRIALRCIAAGTIMELQLGRNCSLDTPFPPLQGALLPGEAELLPYQQAVLRELSPNGEETALKLIERVSKLHKKSLKAIEKPIADLLKEKGLIDEVQTLLACDLNYSVQGMELRDYRSDKSVYFRTAEEIRAEILEDDEMDTENISLFFLLRESGCIHDLFSEQEMPIVDIQMQKAFQFNSEARKLLALHIYATLEASMQSYLNRKKEMASTDVGIGLNFVFPIFERSQSIFIDTERLFENDEDFLKNILERLKYHDVEVLRRGKVPLLRIDNVLYEAVPSAVPVRIPIYGARLRRYPLFR